MDEPDIVLIRFPELVPAIDIAMLPILGFLNVFELITFLFQAEFEDTLLLQS